MIWLVINGQSSLYGSQADGMKALTDTLADRRGRGCTITPTGAPAYGVEYHVQHSGAGGFEKIYLTHDEPDTTQDGDQ